MCVSVCVYIYILYNRHLRHAELDLQGRLVCLGRYQCTWYYSYNGTSSRSTTHCCLRRPCVRVCMCVRERACVRVCARTCAF